MSPRSTIERKKAVERARGALHNANTGIGAKRIPQRRVTAFSFGGSSLLCRERCLPGAGDLEGGQPMRPSGLWAIGVGLGRPVKEDDHGRFHHPCLVDRARPPGT